MKISIKGLNENFLYINQHLFAQLSDDDKQTIINLDHITENYRGIKSADLNGSVPERTHLHINGLTTASAKDSDILEYARFIKKLEVKKLSYSCLYNNDEAFNFKSYTAMKDLGLDPIPVYSVGHNLKALEHYCFHSPRIVVTNTDKSPKVATIETVKSIIGSHLKPYADIGGQIICEDISLKCIGLFDWPIATSDLWFKIASSGAIMLGGEVVLMIDDPDLIANKKHFFNFSEFEQEQLLDLACENPDDPATVTAFQDLGVRAAYNIRDSFRLVNDTNAELIDRHICEGIF